MDSGLGMDVLRIVLGRDLNEKTGTGAANVRESERSDSRAGEKEDVVMDAGTTEVQNVGVDGKLKLFNEDRRVLSAALSAVCNIVNDFSPLRPVSSSSLFWLGLQLMLDEDLLGGEAHASTCFYTATIW